MKKVIYLLPLVFLGCSFNNTTEKVKKFTECFVSKLPAPFWVCYQSPFLSVGKVYSEKVNRLKQEEAYSLGVGDLVVKLQSKTKLFLRKLGIEDKKIEGEIKDFVILNNLQGDTWYNKKDKMLYVQVKINENEFKKFLFNRYKKIDKKILETAYNETF